MAEYVRGNPPPATRQVGDLYTAYPGLGIAASYYEGVSEIHKFGANEEIDTAQGDADIWDGGTNTLSATGVYPWPTSATVLHITGAAADDGLSDPIGTGAQTVEIQGLDSSYNLLTESITTNGATNAITTGEFIRVFRMKVTAAGSGGKNAGPIQADNPSGVLLAQISTGNNQTLMALYTVPADKTGYLTKHSFNLGVNGGPKTASVATSVYYRPFGQVFQLKDHASLIGTANSSYVVTHVVPHAIAAKTDIVLRALTDTNDTEVEAGFDLILIDN